MHFWWIIKLREYLEKNTAVLKISAPELPRINQGSHSYPCSERTPG